MILLIENAAPVHIDQVGKKLFLEGIYIMADKKNGNSRIYPSDVVERAVDRIQHKIHGGEMFGTLGHGESTTVEPSAISHVVQSLKRKGSDWWGRSRVIDGGQGSVLRSIIDANGKLGISSKSSGNVKKTKEDLWEVCDPLDIHSFDCVTSPSTQHVANAIYESILMEAEEDSRNRGNKLSDENLKSKAAEITAHLMRVLGNAHPEILAAQNANAIDWDRDVMPYTNPLDTRTGLEIAEADRAKLVAALLKLAQEISAQDPVGGVTADGKARDIVGQYAKAIARTSDPITKTSLRREAARQIYGRRLVEATCRFLGRQSNLTVKNDNSIIENIRKNAGSRLTSTDRELAEVIAQHKRNRK
jgi:hypothetical protein